MFNNTTYKHQLLPRFRLKNLCLRRLLRIFLNRNARYFVWCWVLYLGSLSNPHKKIWGDNICTPRALKRLWNYTFFLEKLFIQFWNFPPCWLLRSLMCKCIASSNWKLWSSHMARSELRLFYPKIFAPKNMKWSCTHASKRIKTIGLNIITYKLDPQDHHTQHYTIFSHKWSS